jgi:hypothetical protein
MPVRGDLKGHEKRRMRKIGEQEEDADCCLKSCLPEALGLMRRRQKVEMAALTNGRMKKETKNKSEELKAKKNFGWRNIRSSGCGLAKRKVSEGVEPSLAESESAVITVRPRNLVICDFSGPRFEPITYALC